MGAIQQVLLAGNRVNQYSALVLASGPVQYWRFGESSGTVAFDTPSGARNGTYTRDASNTTTPGLLNGDSNTAFLGPASTSTPVSGIKYAGVAASPSGNFTVTVIIQPSGVPPSSGVGGLLQLGANGGGCPELAVVDQGGGLFKVRVNRSGVSTIILSTSSFAYGTKLHVKLSRNTGNAIALRINGAAEGSATFAFALASTTTNIGLNNTGSGDGFQFAGVIDEFAVWNSFIADATTDAQYAAI